jgi:hypothetical protein
MMAERQQKELEVEPLRALRVGRSAGEHRCRFVGDAGDDRSDFALLGFLPKVEKRLAFQLASKEGIGPRPGNPEGIE